MKLIAESSGVAARLSGTEYIYKTCAESVRNDAHLGGIFEAACQANGERLRIVIPLPGYSVRLSAWKVQVGSTKIVYAENTPMSVRVAEGRGVRSILHTDRISTRGKPAAFGLKIIA